MKSVCKATIFKGSLIDGRRLLLLLFEFESLAQNTKRKVEKLFCLRWKKRHSYRLTQFTLYIHAAYRPIFGAPGDAMQPFIPLCQRERFN